MAKIVIRCRSTDNGALTTIVASTFDVEVEEAEVSKSGKHWDEIATGPEDGVIVVRDISNSGKHNCYVKDLSGFVIRNIRLPEGSNCVCEITSEGLIRTLWPEG